MNFKIVEGTNHVEEMPEDFEVDFLNPHISSKELFQKHNLSRGVFWKLCRRVREKHNLMRKPVKGKYYSVYKGYYHIRRSFNKKEYHYACIPVGREDVLEETLRICEELDWDYELCRKKIKELKK